MEPEKRRVTLADVRGAVEQLGGDPSATNAARVREILGRGGFSTIQRHLEALRDAQKGPVEESPQEAPEAPGELVQGLWAAAWSEASRRQAEALSGALARIDALEAARAVAGADLAAMTERMDTLEAERDAALARAAAAEQAAAEERQAIAGERAALEALLARLEAMMPTGED